MNLFFLHDVCICNCNMLLKVSSGTSHMTCLPKMESSKASGKETCLFHSRDGSMLGWDVQQSGDKLIKITNSI